MLIYLAALLDDESDRIRLTMIFSIKIREYCLKTAGSAAS